MREIYEQICAGRDVRANLIELKRLVKEEKNAEAFAKICGNNYDVIMKCLASGDPKVRKNAADLLGILKVQEAVDVLMDAYREEETLYVRPDYVTALAGMDCGGYEEELQERLADLQSREVPDDERKHVQAEIRALTELLLERGVIKRHTFTGYHRANSVILTTLPAFRDILSADLPFQKTAVPYGLAVSVGEMGPVLECRYWQEMLFVLAGEPDTQAKAEEIAEWLVRSDLMTILRENHKEPAPFYFRVGVSGSIPDRERSLLAKQAGGAIEKSFGGELINSASHFEVEIRLVVSREGRATPCLKMYTIPDNRFRYRRFHVSAGMRPSVAAGLIGLAKPYLKENAQVLDPFCGVGTLLIERRLAGPVRSAYGIDTFGEAIESARKNTRIVGMPVNYINRNFFDFTHDYLFDEIITDLPTRIGSREETDDFYRRFFEKSEEMLAEKGRVFCYSEEMGLIKKYLRIFGRFRLLREIPILDASGTCFFIMERKS